MFFIVFQQKVCSCLPPSQQKIFAPFGKKSADAHALTFCWNTQYLIKVIKNLHAHRTYIPNKSKGCNLLSRRSHTFQQQLFFCWQPVLPGVSDIAQAIVEILILPRHYQYCLGITGNAGLLILPATYILYLSADKLYLSADKLYEFHAAIFVLRATIFICLRPFYFIYLRRFVPEPNETIWLFISFYYL